MEQWLKKIAGKSFKEELEKIAFKLPTRYKGLKSFLSAKKGVANLSIKQMTKLRKPTL